MAERRMFTKKITDSDAFTALPPTTQALYFHMCMAADDDGFCNKIRQAMFNAHADTNDFNLLVEKRFIIPFDEKGVIVIKHWRLHNYVQNDRYHKTEYVEEKAKLIIKNNGVYTEKTDDVYNMDTECIQDGYKVDTEVRLGKVRLGKDNNAREDAPWFEDDNLNEAFKEYIEHRKKIKAPMTDLAIKKAINRLNQLSGGDINKSIAIIDQSIINGWRGLFPLNENSKATKQGSTKAEELNDFYKMAAEWAESED